MSWLGEGARGVASEDTHSNSCSVPLCIPPAQHGAFLQEMEMLLAASVQGQMVARKARLGFSNHPDRFPGVVSLHLGWPWERSPR